MPSYISAYVQKSSEQFSLSEILLRNSLQFFGKYLPLSICNVHRQQVEIEVAQCL